MDHKGKLIGPNDIEAQTHAVFQNLNRVLESVDLGVADLVRLNTYYVGSVPEAEVTAYWERMTHVRLQYLTSPGPAAMAVRVDSTGVDGGLIELEAEAKLDKRDRGAMRIMPADSWDWSISVPFSQGWRCGDRIWVGGQVSADSQGRAVYPGDATKQTHNVMRFIHNVLKDGKASLDDLCHLRICYQHTGDPVDAKARLRQIMKVVRQYCGRVPPITAFGANLLYGGLVVEIDASAVVGDGMSALPLPARENVNWTAETYAVRKGGLVHFAGYSPPTGTRTDVIQDTRRAAQAMLDSLSAIEVPPHRIGRLNVYHCLTDLHHQSGLLPTDVTKVVRDVFDSDVPPITLVRTAGLPGGANLQMHGLCLME